MKGVKKYKQICWLAIVVISLLLSGFFTAASANRVIELLRDRDPVSCVTQSESILQKYILIEVPDAIATLILVTGGDGLLYIHDWFFSFKGLNFLVRNRYSFVSFGFNVAVIDASTDFYSCSQGLYGWRLSEEHQSDIGVVIDDLRMRYPDLPVWIIGTSRGSISAAQAAAVRPPESGGPDGLVLTSSVTIRGEPTFNCVFDVALENIVVPTLISSHKQDGCWKTPPSDMKEIKKRLILAPYVKKRGFNGGYQPLSPPCEALAEHGFFGIEPKVVKYIAEWIKNQVDD